MKKVSLASMPLFFTTRFFLAWGIVALLFILSYLIPVFGIISKGMLFLIASLTLIDLGILFATKAHIKSSRSVNELLSNADDNPIILRLKSTYKIPLSFLLIDELPYQLQLRDFQLSGTLEPFITTERTYTIKPKQRGEYVFGAIHCYVSSALQLVQRRFTTEASQMVKVYPSFSHIRRFQIKAIPEMQASGGGTRQYKRGVSTEFDHIKEYNRGDDARTINWKASARRNQLMINSFMDEKSQQIYCLIDKGRLMKMPFDGLTLLDYSINASLMFSFVALQKNDKIGLITFGETVHDVVQASKSKKQFNIIMEVLYKQETHFLESNFAELCKVVHHKTGQRSLLLLFTNFETLKGFERQLPFLRMLNQKHLLCVILFENTELAKLHQDRGDDLEDIYIKTIADNFIYEKKMIVKELQKNGILVIYTAPSRLNVDVVNTYLELKARQFI